MSEEKIFDRDTVPLVIFVIYTGGLLVALALPIGFTIVYGAAGYYAMKFLVLHFYPIDKEQP